MTTPLENTAKFEAEAQRIAQHVEDVLEQLSLESVAAMSDDTIEHEDFLSLVFDMQQRIYKSI